MTKIVATIIILGFLFSMSMASCGRNKSNRANLLDPNLKYQADTMFSRRRTLIEKELDSLCLVRQPVMVDNLVDSLVEEQLKQINDILKSNSAQ